MGTLRVVVGGQFGSEAKGAVTGFLAQTSNPDKHVVVRVAGPNAGHTAYDDQGRKWALRQIPVAAVTNPNAKLVIAAGSEIDPPVLFDEIQRLEAVGIEVSSRLYVDSAATVITDAHKLEEGAMNLVGRIGSTGKGIGAARADRIWRTADTWRQWYANTDGAGFGAPLPYNTKLLLEGWAHDGFDVTIEGTQGYGLGLHTRFYPKVTSSDCRAMDFLAMAGISPWHPGIDGFKVFVVVRAFPIRVAGDSGPLLGETTWAELGLPEEKTTVTQKVRRVGAWDAELVEDAVRANGGGAPGVVNLAFTMADQKYPALAGFNGPIGVQDDGSFDYNRLNPGFATADAGKAFADLFEFLAGVSDETGALVSYIGTGPNTRVWFE